MHKPVAEASDRLVEILGVQIERLRWGTPIDKGGESDIRLVREKIEALLIYREDLEPELKVLLEKLDTIDPGASNIEEFIERKGNKLSERVYIYFYELKGRVDKILGYGTFDEDRKLELINARADIKFYISIFKCMKQELEELDAKLDAIDPNISIGADEIKKASPPKHQSLFEFMDESLPDGGSAIGVG